MLDYDRIYVVSEGIDINKTNDLCEYTVCHYNYFFAILGFSFGI